jgi:putative phosphoribosyl transferase
MIGAIGGTFVALHELGWGLVLPTCDAAKLSRKCSSGAIFMRFKDRREAGRLLADKLQHYAQQLEVIVLALPRGGVPVAFEVAEKLDAPMDIFVVRKLGTPGQKELAMGALASGGVRVLNEDVVRVLHIPPDVIDMVTTQEQQEVARCEIAYRGKPWARDLKGHTVILVDDGLATGSTMHAAVAGLKQRRPSGIVVAVPVAPSSTLRTLEAQADEVVCAFTPDEPFEAVGRWYLDFSQTTDDEVRDLLSRAAHRLPPERT